MERRKRCKKGVIAVVIMSLFLSACGANANNEEKSDVEMSEVVIQDMQVVPMTEEVPQTEAESQTEALHQVDMEIEPREAWEIAKQSGTVEAFEDYFNLDMKEYTSVCEKKGSIEEITYTSEVWGAERSAQVYTPYGYDRNKSYPIIYLIHGIGCDSSQWVSMGVRNIFDHMIDKGELEPFVAVFPSVIPLGGIDSNTLGEKNIHAFRVFVEEFKTDLHPYMIKYYHASTNREDTAVCGLSMGGMEALRLGFTYLDTFQFIGSFSAAPTLEMDLLNTKDNEYAPELVLVCTGDKDATVGDNPYNYHCELSKNEVEHIWYVHPGQSHSPGVWNLGLFNFLKRLSGGFLP